MPGPYVLTIDVGTGSGRAALFDRSGRQVSRGKREWAPEPVSRYPGALNFNTREAWRLLVECIREAMGKVEASGKDVAGVTATSMREGMVLYDKGKNEIWACPNADGRARGEAEEMVKAGLGERMYNTGGDWISLISPARFWWIRRHLPDLYRNIAHMNMSSDWVLFKLSGEIVTDVSCGSSSGIFDLQKRTWSRELVEEAGLPGGIYPAVHETATIIGKVTGEAAGQTAIVADHALIDPGYRLRTLCHAVPGQWMVEGIGFYHGFTIRWFRDGFCTEEVKRARELGIDPYFLMEKLAERVPPGSNDVQALFSNVMNARSWKHGPPTFAGFDILRPQATGKAACIRALEENAAYTSRAHYEILKDISGYTPREITFCGGSSKGFLWPQIMADVLPIEHNVWKYNHAYELWRKVYPYILSISDADLLPSMWRAPGT